MYESEEVEYECSACQRRQPWRPESAGRQVTCACGTVLSVPFMPGSAEPRSLRGQPVGPQAEADEVGASAVAEDRDEAGGPINLCPDCGAGMRRGAIVCPHCGYHRPKPKKRVFRRRAETQAETATRRGPASDHWDELTIRPFRDRKLPITLAVAGFLVQVSLLAHFFGQSAGSPHNWADALAIAPLIALLAAGTVAIIFLITLFFTPLLDLSLGPVGPLTIKLAAAVIFPPAVGVWLWALCGQGPTGIAIGWMASLIIYLSLFRLLFEFDWPDSLLLIAFVSLAHTVILLMVLLPLTFGPLPLADLWKLYKPIVAQSVLTFLIAGGLVAPHFGQA